MLAVQQGRSLSEVLPALPADLRPGVQALTFHVLRHLGMVRALVRHLVPRPPEPGVAALLGSALSLLGAAHTGPRYAPHTVVNQAVQAARQHRKTQAQAALINACLRRFLREQDSLLPQLAPQAEAHWNHPRWWIERLQHDHPDHWPSILQANNQPGPLCLRVNRRQISRTDYQQALQAQGLNAVPVGDDGLLLDRPQPVERLPGFAQGWVSVQDAAAQAAAGLLLAGRTWSRADRVLDACAAPGGKTAHLLERADLDLLALDVDAQRCTRIHDNLQRLRLSAEVRCADAAQPAHWWDGRAFDAILLDAPCTASGIVRRHPDVRWLRRESDVAQLVAIQQLLLEALWPLLKPGGRLLYATCSVFKAEGHDQVAAFLQRHPDAQLQPSPGHCLPQAGPTDHDIQQHLTDTLNDNPARTHDGFFYARLDKTRP